MPRKTFRKIVVLKQLNIRLRVEVSDTKTSTPDIAMLGQFSVNTGKFVEEAKESVRGVEDGVIVKLKLERPKTGEMRVSLIGIEGSYSIKCESNGEGENTISSGSIYNTARSMLRYERRDRGVERIRRNLIGTVIGMGMEITERRFIRD